MAWALRAVLALRDAASDIGWEGEMRHLPMVGVALTPPTAMPYLVVKQDNNGETFVVADSELSGLGEHTRVVKTVSRRIGAWFPEDPDPETEPDF